MLALLGRNSKRLFFDANCEDACREEKPSRQQPFF